MLTYETILIPYLKSKRKLHIYLPDNYHTNKKRYSTLYFFDGHNLFEDNNATYGRSWRMSDYMQSSMDQCIIVGIECNHEGNKRIEEYTPYDFVDSQLGAIKGESIKFSNWIVKKLIPYIESKYRTKTDCIHRAIGGSSMGGLCSIYTWYSFENTFNSCICISPYFTPIYDKLLKTFNNCKKRKQFIYLSWGANEDKRKIDFAIVSKININIIQSLHQQSFNIYTNLLLEGNHSEESWEKEIPTFMQALSENTKFFH